MSRFFWVRHGPTHEKAFVGQRDVPADLSDTAAIARLTLALPEDALLVSSDLSRSIATADAIQGNKTRLPHLTDLREFDFGQWDGLRFYEVEERWPDLSRAYWETPGDVSPPDGESWNDAARRVGAAVDRLKTDHPNRDIVVVAHFGVILTQVQRALSVRPQEVLAHRIDPLSLTTIDDAEGVIGINHQP